MSKRIFSNYHNGSEEKILNKCPLCNSELEYHSLMQYSNVYKILKNGTVSKTKKRQEYNGSMDCGFICCTKCEFSTDCDLDVIDNNNIHVWQDVSGFKYTID